MNLDEVRDRFLADKRVATKRRRTASPSTLRSYKEHITSFIHFVISETGSAHVRHMTSANARAWFAKRQARGLSEHSLNLDSTAVRELAAWGAKKKHWSYEAVDDIPRLGKPECLPKPYAADERDRMMDLALTLEEQTIRGLLYYAGLRRAEVLSLRIMDIAPPHEMANGEVLTGQLRVIGKGRKPRAVPVHPALWTTLEAYLRLLHGHPLDRPLFANAEGQPWGPTWLRRRVREWAALAKVDQATSHRYRHTFGTDYLDANPDDLLTLKELMGHASVTTTQGYAKVSDSRKRAGIAKLPTFHTMRPDFVTPQAGAAEPETPPGSNPSPPQAEA